MKICICGGGGLGHTCAGVLSAHESVTVNLLTGHPEAWNHEFRVNLPDGNSLTGKVDVISNNPREAIEECDIILLCLPSYLVEETILKLRDYLTVNQIIGTVVSNSGFFIFCHRHLPQTTPLFGFQRVPYVSRVVKYGCEANLLGFRPELLMAVENIADKEDFQKQIERLFREKVSLVKSFYEITLSNSNPILHTGRLYTMWHDWNGQPFDRQSFFYREWTDEASELEIEMDKEFFKLLSVLGINTEHIDTLLAHYESTDAVSMTRKIQSIESFSTILSPMKKTDNGWIPDFGSRYFTEDFPYGLRMIHDLAHEHHVDVPHIDKVYNWGISVIA